MLFNGQDSAIYARLSLDRSGLSQAVNIQTAEADAFADDNRLNVVLRLSDNDISASKYSRGKKRPGYDLLVAAVKRGQVQIIICTEMPRLYRKIEELLVLIKLAETTRLIGIWTTDGIGYDLSTPEGIHAAIAAINNAALESARLSKRLKRGKGAVARQGKRAGGGRAYGYDYAEGGSFTINDAEAAIYRECVLRVIAGERQIDLVKSLNERGIPSPTGLQWRLSNIKRLMLKKTYIGIRTHNDLEYPAVWPPLITREQYDLMEAAFKAAAQKNHRKSPGFINGRSYLLTGFIYCGACGSLAYGNGRNMGDTYQRRYRCLAWDNYAVRVGCGKVFRAADPLELFVSEAVLYRFDTDEVALALAPKKDEGRVRQLVIQYDHLQRKLAELNNDYYVSTDITLTRAEFARAKSGIEMAIAANRDELARIQSEQAMLTVPSTQAIRGLWDTSSIEWKRHIIQLIVERVTILPGHPGSKVWNGYRFNPEHIEITWKL